MVRRTHFEPKRTDYEHYGCTGQRTARADRRGHDGLQGGAGRDQRRHGSRGRLAAQEGHLQGRQEGRPHRGGRPDRRRQRRLREAAVVEVNSETDFVARNEAFQDDRAQRRQGRAGADGDDRSRGCRQLSRLRQVGRPTTIKDAVGTIGENMGFRRSAKLDGRARRGGDLRPQRRRRRPRQARRAGGAARRPATRRPPAPSPARSPCMSRPPTRWR